VLTFFLNLFKPETLIPLYGISMEVFKQRKGITPVIAIVLLLMVTVGAVGVVYTQFNSLVGNPEEQFEEQQQDQNTQISITSIEASGDISSADPSGVYMNLTITNSGSVARNISDFMVTAQGADIVESEYNCFGDDPNIGDAETGILSTGDTYTCNTGIPFPGVTDEATVEVRLTGTSKTWTETCRPTQTGQETC
jgi:flagellin-like protein